MPATAQINSNSVIHRSHEKFLANSMGDETVMMNMESGDYLGVNGVGTDIWNLLSDPLTVNQLINKILEMYEVSEDQCTAEVNAFLSRMLEQGMVTVENV